MITVLYFSDSTVRQQLFDAVSRAQKPLLVSGVRHGKGMRAPQFREPFAGLESAFGHVVDQIVVADEGSIEGMWRDPLGDLADALFPDDRAKAYAAASGYALLQGRRVLGVVKKHASPAEDRWFIQELLASVFADVPTPPKAQRPGAGPRPEQGGGGTESSEQDRRRDSERGSHSGKHASGGDRHRRDREEQESRRIEDEDTNPRARRPAIAATPDPYAVLGLTRGVGKDEAKKAFRALIAQYHPDKVSHLAPEFRDLADRRTREILAAWEIVEKEVG